MRAAASRKPSNGDPISYQLKRPWPDGRTHWVLEPVAFLLARRLGLGTIFGRGIVDLTRGHAQNTPDSNALQIFLRKNATPMSSAPRRLRRSHERT